MLGRFIFLLFALFALTYARADDDDDSFSGFLDGFGDVIESIDFSGFSGGSSSWGDSGTSWRSSDDSRSYSNYGGSTHHHHYHHNNWVDNYFNLRLIDSLFPVNSRVGDNSNQVVEIDPIMKYPLMGITFISLSLIIIFPALDIYKRRPFKGKRVINIPKIWIVGMIGWIIFYFACFIVKLSALAMIVHFPEFFSSFWPWFLGTIGTLYGAYLLRTTYRRSPYRVVKMHIV